jgi:hypothetical protein
MSADVVELAYKGEWHRLLRHLESQPHLVNSTSAKGYTPLHQAAWHGAEPRVIGALLALGAHVFARTFSRNQSAEEIAFEKHPEREDLHFLLADRGRLLAPLLRKLIVETPELFTDYDGNRVLCDRVIECLCSGDPQRDEADVGQALVAAICAVAGSRFFDQGSVTLGTSGIEMKATSTLWLQRIVPAVVEMAARAKSVPLAPSFAVMSDLFNPTPSQWGARGDPFLWMEMGRALCHVPIPKEDREVERILHGCFAALIGTELKGDQAFYVERFARGGMSSGTVSGEAWSNTLLPMLRQRARWLCESWAG